MLDFKTRRRRGRVALTITLTLGIVFSPMPNAPGDPAQTRDPGAFGIAGDNLGSLATAGRSLLSKVFGTAKAIFGGLGGPSRAFAQIPTPTPTPSLLPTPPVEPPPVDPPQDTRQEDVSLRTENAKFFRETDGRLIAEFHTGPIHFRTAEGVWEEIDTTIVPSTRPGYAFRNRRGAFTVDFAPSVGVADTVRLESGSDTIRFSPVGASPLSVPRAEGSRVTYPEVYPGVDLTYEVRNNGLKELLVLKERPQVPVSYTFLLGLSGLTAEQQQGAVSLIDAGGDTDFTIPPAWMEDSADPQNDGAVRSYDVTLQLSTEGGQLSLELTPDIAWLQDPARVYPVVIDPSIYNPNTNFDTYVDSGAAATGHGSLEVLKIGKESSTGPVRRTLLKFDGVAAALRNKVILQAWLFMHETYAPNCTPQVVNVQRATGDWGAGVTWNSQPPVGETVASAAFAHGAPGCSGAWEALGVYQAVSNWTSGAWSNQGLRVVAAAESNPDARKRFTSSEYCCNGEYSPFLGVEYNSYPDPPTNLSPPSGTASTDSTPTFSAVYNDPDRGDRGSVEFEVYRHSDGSLVYSGEGNLVNPGEVSTLTAQLPFCGETYDWRARSVDSINYTSAWTSGGSYTAIYSQEPTPKSPADGATVHTFTPTLTAQGPAGSTYQFVITSGGTEVIRSDSLPIPTWTVPDGVLADGGNYEWQVLGTAGVCGSAPRTFRLDVQRLGPRSHFPLVDFSLGHGTAASVNAANGNFIVSQTDASLPTVEDPFVLSRTYNSRGAGKLIYVEDQLPYKATPHETWEWDNLVKWSGTSSHKEANEPGAHQHYFQGAEAKLFVPHGSSIVTYAFLDPANPPREVMLQFHTPDADDWKHRGYWADTDDLTGWGPNGTTAMKKIGNLPATGQWVRLEVPASEVGLDGKIIDGVAYTLFDGQVWFDKTYLGAGPSGYGWTMSNQLAYSELSFARLIERTDNAHLELVDSYGGSHFYYPTGTPNQYKSESGDFATVTKKVVEGEEWELKNAEGFLYYFDALNGRLKRILSPERTAGTMKTFSYTYTGEGRLQSIRDRLDRQLSFTYHPDGMLYQIKADFDAGRVLATYEYQQDQLTAVTDANGHRTEYTYDPVTHDLLTITTPRGVASAPLGDFVTSVNYHPRLSGEEYGRVQAVKRRHTEGTTTTDLVTSFAYTPDSRTTKVTFPKGNVTPADPNDFVSSIEYNERLNPIRITDSAGNATVMEWNTKNLRTRLVDQLNNEWLFDYDGNGNLCRETLPASVLNRAGQRAKTEYFYDEGFGGNYTCSASTKPEYNLRTRVVDAEGRVTKTEYVAPTSGKPWIKEVSVGYGTPEAAITSYTYFDDASQPWKYGKVQTRVMPKGNAPSCDQTCRASYTTTYDYWGPGDLYSLPSEGLINVDQRGWLKFTSQPGDTPVTCGSESATVCHHYDARGNKIHRLDAKGDHYQLFDPDNRPVRSQDLGASGAPDPARWVQVAYDADGNRVRVTDPDLSSDSTAFSYDDLGRFVESIDAWGRKTTYQYDQNSNVLTKTTVGIGTTSYTYDGLNRLQTLTDPQGKVTTYAVYDNEGRLLEKRLPNATHVDYAYNAAGWLTSIRNRPGSSHSQSESSQSSLGDTTYTYDGTGKKMTEVLPGSVGTRTYDYDAIGRLEEVVHGSTTRGYVYDRNSNRTDLQVNGITTETYTYNALDQLTQVSGAGGPQAFTYNPAGELATHVLPGYVIRSKTRSGTVDAAVSPGFQSWRFDVTAGGPVQATLEWSGTADLNLQLRKIVGNNAILKAQAANGQPESLTYEIPANDTGEYSLRVIAASGQANYTLSFSYPVAKQRSYSYDAGGIPVFEDNSVSSTTYLVDGLDRVIRKTDRNFEGAVTSDVKFAFEGADDSRVAEVHPTNSSILASFVTDPHGLLAVRRNGANTYQYFNDHGDVVQTANEAGTPLNSTPMVFDEFGARTGGPFPHGWNGRQQRDTSSASGTIRMGVRLYDPSLGRFLSRDPVEGGSLNDYEYGGGDPINVYDLSGQGFCIFGHHSHGGCRGGSLWNGFVNGLRAAIRGIKKAFSAVFSCFKSFENLIGCYETLEFYVGVTIASVGMVLLGVGIVTVVCTSGLGTAMCLAGILSGGEVTFAGVFIGYQVLKEIRKRGGKVVEF